MEMLFWIVIACFTLGSSWIAVQVYLEDQAIRKARRQRDAEQEAAFIKRAERQRNYQRFIRSSVARDGKPWEHPR